MGRAGKQHALFWPLRQDLIGIVAVPSQGKQVCALSVTRESPVTSKVLRLPVAAALEVPGLLLAAALLPFSSTHLLTALWMRSANGPGMPPAKLSLVTALFPEE